MSSPLEPVSRSADFWFDDGNLVLQVETMQFRIHRGLICANSVVFRDMHGLPQPEERDSIDGCPVVLLQGDTEADWINLLEYIYFPAKASQDGDYLSFPRVASMLRLGSKYEFAEIRSLALRTIHTQVPTHGLDAWDNFFNPDRRWTLTSSVINYGLMPVGSIPGDWLEDNEFDLLNLAIEQDVQTILPVVYYLCNNNHTLQDILCGITRKDGTHSMVHGNALRLLILGRQKLHGEFFTRTMSWLSQGNIPTPSCSKAPPEPFAEETELDGMTLCQQSGMHGLQRIVSDDLDYVGALDVLDDLWDPGFCKGCMDKIRQISREERLAIWQRLPYYFNLRPWGRLKDRE